MPWTKTDYPDSMKNLDAEIRNKAIEMANAMIEDGMEEGRAISIATARARDYVNGTDDSSRPHYIVKWKEDEWVLMKKAGERAIKKASTKEALLEEAKPYVNEQDGILTVYKEDGSVADTLYD
ncbi:hypothetical protein CF394_09995 [Tetzosporium hominis]|uniref:DUF2188 domain-containing protein n=1 Tax=Tetzosporium hominis TaxID=2020506 RepID=A0A264W1U3_9BACL|nr:hypothetical protein [Tetzosporium hominis]OZS77539.1 hypothetical protein CF394_09995 [Tetzosporium hominis]